MSIISKPTAGLYVHIPFCAHICLYCDFYSKIPNTGEIEAFLDAIDAEARLRAVSNYGEFLYDSIFLGGGTPTLLNPSQIEKLFESLRANFSLADDSEITIECNPSSLSAELLCAFRSVGINRISLGIQSFNDTHLQRLGRIHNAKSALATYESVRRAGFENVSIDLIYGLPAQTISEWQADLASAARLEPNHISAYNLIVEPNTPFGELYSNGKLELPSDDTQNAMYDSLNDCLVESGLLRYEISNFAGPAFECRHNLKYWHLNPFLGLGPAAVSFDGLIRTRNAADLDTYLRAASQNAIPPCEIEIIDSAKLREETIMMSLRLSEGLYCRKLINEFDYDILSDKADEIRTLSDNGFIIFDGDRIKLTQKALFISDEIIVKLI